MQGTDGLEDMEKDFRSAPKCFWKTIQHLRRGKRGTIQAVYSKDGTLLTSTEEVVGRWKEHFEELLNPTNMPSMLEAELEVDGVSSSISLVEVTEVVKHLCSGKAPGIDGIQTEMLKALGVEGLSRLTRLFNIAWDLVQCQKSGKPGWWFHCSKRGTRECANYRDATLLSLPGKVYSKVLGRIEEEQCGFCPRRGTTDQLFTLARIMEGSWEYAHLVTCVLWIWRRRMTGCPGRNCGRCCGSMG